MSVETLRDVIVGNMASAETAAKLEMLFRADAPRLWRSLLLFTGSRDIADDAVAEAFAQALRRGDAIKEPSAWIRRVAFQLARSELQRQRSQVELTDVPLEMPESVVELREALATLSPNQRASVVLADYAGVSHREIARILGSTISAVGVHVYRGRRRLRDLLEEA